MRIAIIACGSRGDVQPYLALGRAHGLEFWPLSGNVKSVAESPEMRALLEKGNFPAIMRQAGQALQVAARNWARERLAACQGMDTLMAGFGGLFTGAAIAEKLNLPLIQAHYVPFTPTRVFPAALFPAGIARLGGATHRLSHHRMRQVMCRQARTANGPARQQVLGLPAAPFAGPYHVRPLAHTPVLYDFNPVVIARAADWAAPQSPGDGG